MNIFVLDIDPVLASKYHCDKHLVKMITEHNQILGSIAYTSRGVTSKKLVTPEFLKSVFSDFPRQKEGEPHPYGIGFKHHPCTVWAGSTSGNYKWLCKLTTEMCKEYTRRYDKIHAGESIVDWYTSNAPDLPAGMTQFALAMPADLRSENAVHSYRLYYAKYKNKFAKWKMGEPTWWKEYLEM